MVAPATGAHCGLLERPQSRRRLASVPDPRRIVTSGVTQHDDERPHARGDAREVAEEVERGALGREDRRQRAAHATDDGARANERTFVGSPFDLDSFVDLTEGLGGAAGAGEHAGDAHHELGIGAGCGRQQRRRQVAERSEVFGQRPGNCIAHGMQRRMNIRIGLPHGCQGSDRIMAQPRTIRRRRCVSSRSA